MAHTKDFDLLLDAQILLIVIESTDELRVLSLLLNSAIQRRMSFYEWSATRGLRLGGFGNDSSGQTQLTEPIEVLKHIAQTPGPAIYALCDFHSFLDKEPLHVRYLKNIALAHQRLGNIVILVSHAFKIAPELGRFTASFTLQMPTEDELMGMVRKQAQLWSDATRG